MLKRNCTILPPSSGKGNFLKGMLLKMFQPRQCLALQRGFHYCPWETVPKHIRFRSCNLKKEMFLIQIPQFPLVNSMALFLVILPPGTVCIPILRFIPWKAVKSYCILPIDHLAETDKAYWVISGTFFRAQVLNMISVSSAAFFWVKISNLRGPWESP